jgi:tetratricopeptide (TPR) repeat protein
MFVLLGALALLAAPVHASQAQAAGAQTIVVLPFENESHAPGLEWISEAFPEVLGARMAMPSLFVIGRDDRLYAFDRSGIPTNLRLSRATLFRIAEQMDVDYVVLGHYNFDGQAFTAFAQMLDMKRLHLLPEIKESGPLTSLIEIQRSLAWDLLKQVQPEFPTSKADFLASAPAVRLDAFENYMRGISASTRQEKVQRFRETLRINPGYTPAMLQLGKTYFANREYDSAASWFARVPKTDAMAREANFYLGLSALYLGDYAKAEDAFNYVATRLPLTEVYNNLGVVAGRRGKRAELEYFQKAVEADPNDPDYHFNLALALTRAGDTAAGVRQLRECLSLRPADTEAKSLLDTLANGASGGPKPEAAHAANGKLPPARIKRNYDETSFRQLALEIQNLTEARLAKTDPKTHAAYHVEHGNELLHQGFNIEAEAELREAVTLDPASAAAHLGLARALENVGNAAGARSEAQAALRLERSAEAFLVLGRLDLKDNNLQGASDNLEQALALEPTNAKALALKNELAAKRAGKE